MAFGTVGLQHRSAGRLTAREAVTIVSGDFFRLLDVEPALGRGFLPDEDRVAGRDAVVVLESCHVAAGVRLATRRSSDGHVYIAGIEFTIVGVAPEEFTGLHRIVRKRHSSPSRCGRASSAFRTSTR